MKLFIRHASPSDAALIADISRQSFYDTFAPDNTKEDMDKFLAEQFTRGALMMEVGMKEHVFLLAYVDDSIAGYAKLSNRKRPLEIKEEAIEIARIYVLKDFIGKGVGKLLMDAAIGEAVKMEKEVVWLCVWEKNKRAIDFYTYRGFEKFGECDFILGDDVQRDWMMKKALTG